MTTGRRVAGFILVSGFLAGCRTPPPPTAQQLEQGPLAFLHDGQTTRADVLVKLGPPNAQYEGKRIFSYRVIADAAGMHLIPNGRANQANTSSSSKAEYSLVLVFEGNVLSRHSVVTVG